MRKGSRKLSTIFCATWIASSITSRSGRISTNSSPPKRATVSPFRSAALSRSAVALRRRSPNIMAQGVIHALKMIEVEHRDSYFFLIPLGLGQGNTQAIGEELPVGKTRQGIMVNHLLDLFL